MEFGVWNFDWIVHWNTWPSTSTDFDRWGLVVALVTSTCYVNLSRNPTVQCLYLTRAVCSSEFCFAFRSFAVVTGWVDALTASHRIVQTATDHCRWFSFLWVSCLLDSFKNQPVSQSVAEQNVKPISHCRVWQQRSLLSAKLAAPSNRQTLKKH